MVQSFTGFGQQNAQTSRNSYLLKIPVSDSGFYRMSVKSGPYILQNNTVQLYPEEAVNIEVEVKGKAILMYSVKKIIHPEKTLQIFFHQEREGNRHRLMMLKITNPFNRQLSYSASIFLMRSNRWIPTDVFPVKPKLTSFESWPDAIITIALSDWRFE